jgi:hypothetical protein
LQAFFVDGASRARTGDLLGAIQALSQLSYSPNFGPSGAAVGSSSKDNHTTPTGINGARRVLQVQVRGKESPI